MFLRFVLLYSSQNTAARIKSSGEKNRIHLSKQTADLLIVAGLLGSWVQAPRDVMVTAKGKGQLQMYWLAVTTKSSSTIASPTTSHTTAQSTKPVSVLLRLLLGQEKRYNESQPCNLNLTRTTSI